MLRSYYETRSLKTLSLLVLERNRKRNSDETTNINHVSLSQSALKQEELGVAQEKYQYLYEERAGIYEFDSGYISKKYAEELAFKDIVALFIEQHQIDQNCQQVNDFIRQLSRITKLTIN
jgi:hypothetical protein